MDHQLRKLERQAAAGDPEAAARVARLRCKVEGCLKYLFERVFMFNDFQRQRQGITFRFACGDTLDTYIKDEEIFSLIFQGISESIMTRLAKVADTMDVCRRCGECTNMSEKYYQYIVREIGKLIT